MPSARRPFTVVGIFFRQERPAAILISSWWWGRTVAVDFTIVGPTRESAMTHTSLTSTPMDQAARLKDNKSKEPAMQKLRVGLLAFRRRLLWRDAR